MSESLYLYYTFMSESLCLYNTFMSELTIITHSLHPLETCASSLNVEYDMPQSCTASRPEISPHLTISTASANSGGILRRGRPKRTSRSFGAPVSVSSARDRQRRSAASRTEMPRRTRGSLRPLRFARALVFDCAASLRKLRFTTAHFASRATPSRPSRSSAWFKGGETPPCELRA